METRIAFSTHHPNHFWMWFDKDFDGAYLELESVGGGMIDFRTEILKGYNKALSLVLLCNRSGIINKKLKYHEKL